MTSFTIEWNDEGQNRMATRLSSWSSRGLDRFAASKAPSTFLDRPPTVSGKNPLSVLAPIGSGNHRNGGKTTGKKEEKGEKKSKKDRKKKTSANTRKGEMAETSMTGSKTGALLPNTRLIVPDQKFSPYKALGDIKNASEPTTNKTPSVFESMKGNALSIPVGSGDPGKNGPKKIDGRKRGQSPSPKPTGSSPKRYTNQRSSSRAMTKRPSQAVDVNDDVDGSMTENQRRHESLAERVKSLLTLRSQDKTTRKTNAAETYASYRQPSSELANGEAEVCWPRHVNTAAKPSASLGTERGHDLAEEYCPISDDDDILTPHPPASRHVIRSRLVYEYRKRRFKFASLRLKKRAC